MDLGLRGRTAVVMGASAGLGRGIAAALAAEGACVAIVARNEGNLVKTAEEIGAAAAIPGDMQRPGDGRRVVEEAARTLGGGVDIVVTNTGGPPKGAFSEISSAQWQDGFQGLFLAAIEAMNAAMPGMRERKWGRVLLVTSVAAREPIETLTVSNALRAGLLGLVNTVSREVAADGVTVNALLPGYTLTERLAELGKGKSPDEFFSHLTTQIPANRLGRPEELGALAAFLASDRAAYITGQAIACDGGWLRGI